GDWIDYRYILPTRSAEGFPRAIKEVEAEIEKLDVSLVHARGYHATLLALLAARGHCPVVFDPRGIMPAEHIGYQSQAPHSPRVTFWRIAERRMARRAAAVVGVSGPMTNYYKR